MGTAGQVDGLAGVLLQCVDDPDRVALIHALLDRYCHRLRNRLNSMKLSLYLARRLNGESNGDQWAPTEQASRAIETLIDQLQFFCAPLHPAPVPGDLNRFIEDRLADWRQILAARPIRLEAEGPEESLPGQFDWIRLGQSLDGLMLAWATLGPAEATIRLAWWRDPDRFHMRFDGDSDGWLDRPTGDVESLALPLLARVLRAHQGELTIRDDGSTIALSWPAR